MKGKLPTVFAGVVVRNDANALVAFHAITIQFGANFGRVSMRPWQSTSGIRFWPCGPRP